MINEARSLLSVNTRVKSVFATIVIIVLPQAQLSSCLLPLNHVTLFKTIKDETPKPSSCFTLHISRTGVDISNPHHRWSTVAASNGSKINEK